MNTVGVLQSSSDLKRLARQLWKDWSEFATGKAEQKTKLLYNEMHNEKQRSFTRRQIKKITQESKQIHKSGKSFKLNFCALNCWGIVLAPCIEPRMKQIAKEVKDFDVVCFSELFRTDDIIFMRRALHEHGLVYFHSFNQAPGFPGWPGGEGAGMAIVSRYPIVEALQFRFSINGKPHKVQHLDFFAHKGVGCCKILTPAGLVDVYVTHLHADYTDNDLTMSACDDEYKRTRTLQALELSQIVNAHSSSSSLCVIGADLNAPVGSLPYRVVRAVAGMADPMLRGSLRGGGVGGKGGGKKEEKNAEEEEEEEVGLRFPHLMHLREEDEECDPTWCTPGNTLNPPERGKRRRIDFLMVRRGGVGNESGQGFNHNSNLHHGGNIQSQSATGQWKVVKTRVEKWFIEDGPYKGTSVSDHSAISCEVVFTPRAFSADKDAVSSSHSPEATRQQRSIAYIATLKDTLADFQLGEEEARVRIRNHWRRALLHLLLVLFLPVQFLQGWHSSHVVSVLITIEASIAHFAAKKDLRVFRAKSSEVEVLLNTELGLQCGEEEEGGGGKGERAPVREIAGSGARKRRS